MPRPSAIFTGDWDRAARALGGLTTRVLAAKDAALADEGQFYRAKIVAGITSQAPGGKQFKPLSLHTLAIRRALGFGGTKALIRTGDLRGSVTSSPAGPGGVFVGVLYRARGGDGRSMADIAKLNEFGGAIRTRLTKARLRFLRGVLRKARSPVPRSSGRLETDDMIILHIPPRPFLQPVFDMYSGARGAARFAARVSQKLGGTLGTLNHPDLTTRDGRGSLTGRLGGRGAKMMNAAMRGGSKAGSTRGIRSAFKSRKPSRGVRAARKPGRARAKRGSVRNKQVNTRIAAYQAKKAQRASVRSARITKKVNAAKARVKTQKAVAVKVRKTREARLTKRKAIRVAKRERKEAKSRGDVSGAKLKKRLASKSKARRTRVAKTETRSLKKVLKTRLKRPAQRPSPPRVIVLKLPNAPKVKRTPWRVKEAKPKKPAKAKKPAEPKKTQ